MINFCLEIERRSRFSQEECAGIFLLKALDLLNYFGELTGTND